MSFATDINTVLQWNDALNTATGSRIYSKVLPDQFDISLSAIVFNYKKEEGVHTLDKKNVLEIYSLFVVIVSPDTDEIDSLEILVKNLLDNYSDDRILDVTQEGDDDGEDPEKERFYKTLNYTITYKG